jgi:hypothetical protein
MLRHPKRDIFEFEDGKQITLDDLPAGLIFDVLAVPGSEQLSGRTEHGTGCARRGRDGERTFPCSIAGTFLDAGTKKLPRHQGNSLEWCT